MRACLRWKKKEKKSKGTDDMKNIKGIKQIIWSNKINDFDYIDTTVLQLITIPVTKNTAYCCRQWFDSIQYSSRNHIICTSMLYTKLYEYIYIYSSLLSHLFPMSFWYVRYFTNRSLLLSSSSSSFTSGRWCDYKYCLLLLFLTLYQG